MSSGSFVARKFTVPPPQQKPTAPSRRFQPPSPPLNCAAATAPAEADGAESSIRVAMTPDEVRRCQEVFTGLRLIESREQLSCLVFIARVAAEWRKRIGREC